MQFFFRPQAVPIWLSWQQKKTKNKKLIGLFEYNMLSTNFFRAGKGPPHSKHSLCALYQMDTLDKSNGFRKRYIWCAKLLCRCL